MQLDGLPFEELERIYREEPLAPLPDGVWRGHHLGFLDNASTRLRAVRAMHTAMFVWPPFGIDFDRRLWWFFEPRLRVGRFAASAGPSRWRPAEVVRLEYDASRLPWPIRRILYDEVKPLDAETILGLGGVAAGPGRGDHFFFSMRRVG